MHGIQRIGVAGAVLTDGAISKAQVKALLIVTEVEAFLEVEEEQLIAAIQSMEIIDMDAREDFKTQMHLHDWTLSERKSEGDTFANVCELFVMSENISDAFIKLSVEFKSRSVGDRVEFLLLRDVSSIPLMTSQDLSMTKRKRRKRKRTPKHEKTARACALAASLTGGFGKSISSSANRLYRRARMPVKSGMYRSTRARRPTPTSPPPTVAIADPISGVTYPNSGRTVPAT